MLEGAKSHKKDADKSVMEGAPGRLSRKSMRLLISGLWVLAPRSVYTKKSKL